MTTNGVRLLEVNGVSSGYGKKLVVHDVDLQAEKGAVLAVVGHNGAGKSTLLHTIFGLVEVRTGAIRYDGQETEHEGATQRLSRGMSLVPQGRNVFPDLTVKEHLRLVSPSRGARLDSELERAFSLFPALRNKIAALAGTLSGGQRQMLAVAVGVAREPRLLLVDEPSLGLAPILVSEVLMSLRDVSHRLGAAVIVVEQNVRAVLAIADQIVAMRAGQVIFSATGEEARGLKADELWSVL